MISLSAEPSLQVQIGEAISIMAAADFPDQWQNLIDVRVERDMRYTRWADTRFALSINALKQQLVQPLNPNDFVVNNAVLQTAHSIFRR